MAEPRASVNKWPSKGEREREREREKERKRERGSNRIHETLSLWGKCSLSFSLSLSLYLFFAPSVSDCVSPRGREEQIPGRCPIMFLEWKKVDGMCFRCRVVEVC